MPVISLCSPKGGCGKTTTAILIVSELITRGATVSLVGGDRQCWATKWASLRPISDNLRLVNAAGLEDVEFHRLVAAEAKQSTFVICDLAGNINPLITVAMMLSDLVLVPLAKAANYDLAGAVNMFDSIEMISQKLKNPINYLAFFNNVGAIRNRFQIQNEADLETSGVNVMKTRLAERAAYSEYPSFGGLFRDIPSSEVPNLDKAIENIDNFLDEILENLRGEKERRALYERARPTMSSHSGDKVQATPHRQSPLANRVAKIAEQKPTGAMRDFSAGPSDTARGSEIDFSKVHRLEDVEPTLPLAASKKSPSSKSLYDGKIHFRAEQNDIVRLKELLAQFGIKQGFAFKRMVELLEDDLNKR